MFDHGPTFGRTYAGFYNQVRVGELEVELFRYSADHPRVITYIHLDYVRLLSFGTAASEPVPLECSVVGGRSGFQIAASSRIARVGRGGLVAAPNRDYFAARPAAAAAFHRASNCFLR